MNDRLKEIRTTLGYNQNQISEKLNISQAHISALENGSKNITKRIIDDYCREFNVNEKWLKNGTGEMFQEKDDSIIKELATEYNLDDLDMKIIEHYLKLDESDRNAIKKYVSAIATEVSNIKTDDDEIERKLASYETELRLEKSGEMSSATQKQNTEETS